MKSGTRHRGAVDLLGHFLPQHVLRDLRERALLFEREERFRAYLIRRAWFVIPLLLVFVAIGTVPAAALMIFLLGSAAQPVASWFVVAVFCVVAVVWLAIIVAQVYWLFRWLERRARASMRTEK